MKEEAYYGFGKDNSQIYVEKCECGREIEIATQHDDFSEHHTEVIVKCTCGKGVMFNLPVN
jgi:hypothetical protein